MDSAPQHEQQNTQPADSEPKKGAFSGKLLGIIGAALALLIVIILVVVMLLPRGGSDSSDHSKQAAGTSHLGERPVVGWLVLDHRGRGEAARGRVQGAQGDRHRG